MLECTENEDEDVLRFALELQKASLEKIKKEIDFVQRQSERMLVLQTLFFTAYYTLLPTMLKELSCDAEKIWFFTALLTILVIISLLLTLVAQLGLFKKRPADFSKSNTKEISLKTECDRIQVQIKMYQSEIEYYKQLQRFRSIFIQCALLLFIASIVVALVFTILLCVRG